MKDIKKSFVLNMALDIHKKLKMMAVDKGISMNELVIMFIEDGLDKNQEEQE